MKTIKMSPPWIQYVNKLNALFGRDKEVSLVYDNDAVELKMYVETADKAQALSEILPVEKEFGNVTLKITVIPANAFASVEQKFAKAFEGNPILKDTITISEAFTNPITYFVFEKEVVQYYDDNLADPHGLTSTLYQDIADEVFESNHDGVIFCTANVKEQTMEVVDHD